MSGWLDFFEVEITCSFCNADIKFTIWEDGEPKRDPVVISGLFDGKAKCPICGKLFTDEDIKDA